MKKRRCLRLQQQREHFNIEMAFRTTVAFSRLSDSWDDAKVKGRRKYELMIRGPDYSLEQATFTQAGNMVGLTLISPVCWCVLF